MESGINKQYLSHIQITMITQQSNNNATNNQKSQIELAIEALVALKPDITSKDRQEAQDKWSENTIVNYLNGRGKDVDTAVELLQFFKGRIDKRAEAIANATQT